MIKNRFSPRFRALWSRLKQMFSTSTHVLPRRVSVRGDQQPAQAQVGREPGQAGGDVRGADPRGGVARVPGTHRHLQGDKIFAFAFCYKRQIAITGTLAQLKPDTRGAHVEIRTFGLRLFNYLKCLTLVQTGQKCPLYVTETTGGNVAEANWRSGAVPGYARSRAREQLGRTRLPHQVQRPHTRIFF